MSNFTHTITRAYRDSSGVTIQSTESIVGDSERNYKGGIAPSTTNLEIDFAVTRANLQSMMLYADNPVSLLLQAATGKSVSGATNTGSTDAIIASVGHGFLVGDRIHIFGIVGATNLNGFYFVKSLPDADSIKLSLTSGGSTVQGNGSAYVSGGSIRKVTALTLAGTTQNDVWNLAVDGLTACPVPYDLDAIYVTNASGTLTAQLDIRALLDQTP